MRYARMEVKSRLDGGNEVKCESSWNKWKGTGRITWPRSHICLPRPSKANRKQLWSVTSYGKGNRTSWSRPRPAGPLSLKMNTYAYQLQPGPRMQLSPHIGADSSECPYACGHPTMDGEHLMITFHCPSHYKTRRDPYRRLLIDVCLGIPCLHYLDCRVFHRGRLPAEV